MDDIWDKYVRVSRGWRLDPIAHVHPRIYLGSANTVDIVTFHKLKITHVINCATSEYTSKTMKAEYGDRYECIDAIDDETFDITSVYPKFESIMNRFLADPESKNVYVHCQCGINRSAFLILMYMCLKFHISIESAVKNVALQRPCCFRNTAFRKQVMEYIKKLE